MDEIIKKTGCGFYSFILLGHGALCYIANAASFMNLPLYLPMITCDVSMDKGMLTAVHFTMYIGMAIGGFLLCSTSDVVGRRTMIAFSLCVEFFSVLGAAFSYGRFTLLFAMLFYGSGLQANMNVIKVLIIESLPRKYRYFGVIFMDMIWIIGMMIALGFFWVTTPTLVFYHSEKQRFLNWRINIILSVFPSILLSCTTSLILESPKYLIFEGRIRDALEVLREIYAVNKSKLFHTYPIAERDLQGKIMDFGINAEHDIPHAITSRRFKIIFLRIHKSMCLLVNKRFLRHTFVAIIFRVILSLGYLPVIILASRTLNYSYNYINDEKQMIDRFQIYYFEDPILRDCDAYENNSVLYQNFAILSTFAILGCGLLMGLIKFMERKFILTCVFFLNGIFSLLLAIAIRSSTLRIVISALFVMSYSMALSCLDLIILDLFPTAIRSTAMGETMISARLIIIFVMIFLTAPVSYVFIGFGILMQVGTILSLCLPKLSKRPLID